MGFILTAESAESAEKKKGVSLLSFPEGFREGVRAAR